MFLNFIFYFKVATYGGNDDGKPCIFPYYYNGSYMYQCINEDRDNYWCSTTDNYDRDKKWAYCQCI